MSNVDQSTVLADLLTKRTGLPFTGTGRKDPVQAVYGSSDDHGLLWYCNVGRWRGQTPWVFTKCRTGEVGRVANAINEAEANGRGWQERVVDRLGGEIVEANNRWHRSIAELLETIVRLFGKEAVYFVGAPPPDVWRIRREGDLLVTSPVFEAPPQWATGNYRWACTVEEAIGALWRRYQAEHDPPGYEWRWCDETRTTAQAKWGGSRRPWLSEVFSRMSVRAAAWRDFWSSARAKCTYGLRGCDD